MSYRDALKVFKLERELSDDETAFLNTLRGMTETERELTVEALSPQTKKLTKRTTTKTASKSRRAASISDAIKGTAGAAGRAVEGNANDPEITGADCGKDGCGWKAEDLIHDPTAGYAGYHPFVARSPAPPAAGRSSSSNGEAAGSSTANTEIVRGDVGSVAREQSSNAGA